LVYYLSEEGFTVKVHDPLVSKENFELEMELQGFPISKKPNVIFCGASVEDSVTGSSAVVVVTEWD